MLDSEAWYFTDSQFRVWIAILLHVNWNHTKARHNGEIIQVEPGQMVTSRGHLSEISGVAQSTVNRAIDQLERSDMIETDRTASGTLLTVSNWQRYQKTPREEDRPDSESYSESDNESYNDSDVESDSESDTLKELEEGEECSTSTTSSSEESPEGGSEGDQLNKAKLMQWTRHKLTKAKQHPDFQALDEFMEDAVSAFGWMVHKRGFEDYELIWIYKNYFAVLVRAIVKGWKEDDNPYGYLKTKVESDIEPEMREARPWQNRNHQKRVERKRKKIRAKFGDD